MRRAMRKLLSCVVILGSCGLLLSSSCARQPVQTFNEPADFVTVEGAFADWSPTANPFTGGQFVLVDASTNEVFTSEVRSNSFKIENVPAQGRYFGLLIGADYQVKGKLAKIAPDNETKYFVFKTGASAGQLGTLVLKNDLLESSQQSDIDFQLTQGVKPKAFDKEYSTTFAANPDIDGDGIPNMLDTDVDDNESKIPNIYDEKTYNKSTIPDSKIPWQHNYAFGIPKIGFFKCDQLIKNERINVWCSLKTPPAFADKITIETFNYNGELLDDGGLSSSDLSQVKDAIAADGLWTGYFPLDVLRNEQLIKAKIKKKSGETLSFFTTLGPRFKYKIIETQGCISLTQSSLSVTCQIDGWEDTPKKSGFYTEIQLRKDNKILAQKRALFETSPIQSSIDNLEDIDSSENVRYSVIVRLIAPAALPGLLGSATEFEKSEVSVEQPPPQ